MSYRCLIPELPEAAEGLGYRTAGTSYGVPRFHTITSSACLLFPFGNVIQMSRCMPAVRRAHTHTHTHTHAELHNNTHAHTHAHTHTHTHTHIYTHTHKH